MAIDRIEHCDQWPHIPDELRVRYDRDLISISNAMRVADERFDSLDAMMDGRVHLRHHRAADGRDV